MTGGRKKEVQVFVELLSGKTITLDIAPADTLDDLWWKLRSKATLPGSEHLQVLLDGKSLSSLDDVEKGSNIRLAGRLRGGAAGSCLKLKKAFKKVDANGDGKLQFDDFLMLLRRGTPDFSEEQAEALFYVVDKDLSGEIDFAEFIDYLFDNKHLEDFILPALEDDTEEEAKAYVLGRPVRVRSAASRGVKQRGMKWGELTWQERKAECMEIEKTMPQLTPQSSLDMSMMFKKSAREPRAAEPASRGVGGFFSQAVGDATADLFSAAARLKQEEAPAEGKTPVARSGGVLLHVGDALNPQGAGHAMARMSQSQLIDYSLTEEDLSWAGESLAMLEEMRSFKEHLRTAGSPLDAIEIERYVAKGTAGWVFQVSRKSTGERVALKLIRMTQVRTGIKEWYVSKLMREEGFANIVFTDEVSYVLERATAPPIIQQELMNAGPVRYYVCFVQEFVDGGTLEGLARDGKLTPAMMLQAMEGVASTLASMHARDVQHRDIKPENVLVSMDGGSLAAVKLCDFGRAEIGSNPKGRADDVRRFGVMLFSLATGEGWTANRLIHEKHSDLVARLQEAVHASGLTGLLGLPAVLEQILDGGLEIKEVVPLLKELRAAL
uniref:Non-specific serine/threonine protein kinase n=1 Tax=Alexandrium monilatum TaxID=311494 RepID=A0A7S4UQH3_9DINO